MLSGALLPHREQWSSKNPATQEFETEWHDFWRDQEQAPTHTESALHCASIHVVPWSGTVNEASREGVMQGHWVKLADHGGTYVVKLKDKGELVERQLLNRNREWSGRWWLRDESSHPKLCIWIEGWILEVPLTGPSGGPHWPLLRDGEETQRQRQDHSIKFKVAHVLSG